MITSHSSVGWAIVFCLDKTPLILPTRSFRVRSRGQLIAHPTRELSRPKQLTLSQRGFTLLEVMVATAILAVGLAAISGAISMAIRSTSLSSGYEQARQVAENQLALFLAQRPEKAQQKQGQQGSVNWQLTAETDREREGLLQVTIEARFFVAGGERSVILSTSEMSRELPEKETSTTTSEE